MLFPSGINLSRKHLHIYLFFWGGGRRTDVYEEFKAKNQLKTIIGGGERAWGRWRADLNQKLK